MEASMVRDKGRWPPIIRYYPKGADVYQSTFRNSCLVWGVIDWQSPNGLSFLVISSPLEPRLRHEGTLPASWGWKGMGLMWVIPDFTLLLDSTVVIGMWTLKSTMHFPCSWGFLWEVKVKVAQLCPTLCHPMHSYSPWNSPGQNTEWVAIPFSRGSSQPRNQTQVSCTAGRFFTKGKPSETDLKKRL